MALVGPLIICLYYSDAPVVGSMKNLLDDVPADLLLVLQHVAPLAPLLFLALWYYTGVLLVVGHNCFLCSVHGGVASLVPLVCWCIFSLSLLMVELSGLDLEVSALCYWTPCLDPLLEMGPSDLPTLEV